LIKAFKDARLSLESLVAGLQHMTKETEESKERFELNSFSNLLPVVYLLIAGDIYSFFSTPYVQVKFFTIAWVVAALVVLRIQHLIQFYSNGRYPYKPLPCALILGAVVLSPWLWLHFAAIPVNLMIKFGLLHNSHAGWVCGFTLLATVTSLTIVAPIIEGWYEILRGAFAFDGSRIKFHRPSFAMQAGLLLFFVGMLLAPIDFFSAKLTHSDVSSDTVNILIGYMATFVAMHWLLRELEKIRLTQVMNRAANWSPVDKALLKHAGGPLTQTMQAYVSNGRRRGAMPRSGKINQHAK
jgi:hypothetical protein